MSSEIRLLGRLFDSLPVGIIVLDRRGHVVVFNREEERLAHRQRDKVVGRPFFTEVAPCMNVKELGKTFERDIEYHELRVTTEFSFPFPFLDQPRDVLVRMLSFVVEDAPYGCLMIQDISAQRSIDRMKETLASLLVHDFKNPLSVVLSNLEFVRADPRISGDLVEPIDDAQTAARRLRGMVVSLLDVTRLESGEVPLERVRQDVRDLVRAAADESQALGRLRDVKIVTELPPRPAESDVDSDLLRRALDNLIENAVRYSPRGGLVSVRLRQAPQLELEVADQGPGVPAALRSQIFDKYVQVKTNQPAGQHNRGLGLTFVRLVARALGGDAELECPSAGGSIFKIVLPASAAP